MRLHCSCSYLVLRGALGKPSRRAVDFSIVRYLVGYRSSFTKIGGCFWCLMNGKLSVYLVRRHGCTLLFSILNTMLKAAMHNAYTSAPFRAKIRHDFTLTRPALLKDILASCNFKCGLLVLSILFYPSHLYRFTF